jgi:hypothetical protein
VDDGTSTLPAGTYYYATTAIAPHGETSINYSNPAGGVYTTVVVSGSGKRVNLSWQNYGGMGNDDARLRRRIYRGTRPGFFDGYWEFPNTVTSFTDNGRAFTATGAAGGSGQSAVVCDGNGAGKPPHMRYVPSRVEDDANYQIVATPSWATTVWVTGKTTTGFTLNFGTAAPDANQTVSWLLFRP